MSNPNNRAEIDRLRKRVLRDRKPTEVYKRWKVLLKSCQTCSNIARCRKDCSLSWSKYLKQVSFWTWAYFQKLCNPIQPHEFWKIKELQSFSLLQSKFCERSDWKAGSSRLFSKYCSNVEYSSSLRREERVFHTTKSLISSIGFVCATIYFTELTKYCTFNILSFFEQRC